MSFSIWRSGRFGKFILMRPIWAKRVKIGTFQGPFCYSSPTVAVRIMKLRQKLADVLLYFGEWAFWKLNFMGSIMGRKGQIGTFHGPFCYNSPTVAVSIMKLRQKFAKVMLYLDKWAFWKIHFDGNNMGQKGQNWHVLRAFLL